MAYPNPDDPTKTPLFTDGTGTGGLRGAATPVPVMAPVNPAAAPALSSTPQPVQMAQQNPATAPALATPPTTYQPQGIPQQGPSQLLQPPDALKKAYSNPAINNAPAPDAPYTDAMGNSYGSAVSPPPAPGGGLPSVDTAVRAIFGGNAPPPTGPGVPGNSLAGAGRGFVNPPLASTLPPVTPVQGPLGGGPMTDPNNKVGYIGAAGVSSGDRIAQMQRDALQTQDLTARKLQQEQFLGGHGSGVMDQLAPEQAARQQFFDEANLRSAAAKGSWSPRGGYKGDAGAVAAASLPIQNRARLQEMSLKNQGDLRGEQLRAQTQMRGQDILAKTSANEQDVQRRGQDVQQYGHELTAQTATARNQYEAMKDKRQFDFDTQKFGVEQAQKNYADRQAAATALPDKIAKYIPTNSEGKPDLDGAAKISSGVQALVGQRLEQLQQHLQRNPSDAAAQRDLNALQTKGIGALDEADLRRMTKQVQLTTQLTGTGRLNPVGNSLVNSDMPITSLRANPGMFGTTYTSNRGDEINARALKDNTILLGMGGRMNADYAKLIEQEKK